MKSAIGANDAILESREGATVGEEGGEIVPGPLEASSRAVSVDSPSTAPGSVGERASGAGFSDKPEMMFTATAVGARAVPGSILASRCGLAPATGRGKRSGVIAGFALRTTRKPRIATHRPNARRTRVTPHRRHSEI
jgi:hypothetical protein